MTPKQTGGQLLGLGKSRKVEEAWFEAESSIILLKVEETPELQPEENALTGVPVFIDDQVGKSAFSCLQEVQRDHSAGITRAAVPLSRDDERPTYPAV